MKKSRTFVYKDQQLNALNAYINATVISITVDSILETADSSTITVDKVSLVNSTNTTISFTDTYSGTDFISVTVFGFETTQHNYTYPILHILVHTAQIQQSTQQILLY